MTEDLSPDEFTFAPLDLNAVAERDRLAGALRISRAAVVLLTEANAGLQRRMDEKDERIAALEKALEGGLEKLFPAWPIEKVLAWPDDFASSDGAIYGATVSLAAVRQLSSALSAPPGKAEARSIVLQNAEKDPSYCPYCMRCDGLARMAKVESLYWRCSDCGAEHDERQPGKAEEPKPVWCECGEKNCDLPRGECTCGMCDECDERLSKAMRVPSSEQGGTGGGR